MSATSLAETIKDRLVAGGIGTFGSTAKNVWAIYIHRTVENPDRTVVVLDSPEFPKMNTLDMDGDKSWHDGGTQILVRGRSQDECFIKSEAVIAILQDEIAIDVVEKEARLKGSPVPTPLGFDGRNRYTISINVPHIWRVVSA